MGTFSASSVFSLIILPENLEEMECLEKMREGTGTQEIQVSYLPEASLLLLCQTGNENNGFELHMDIQVLMFVAGFFAFK